MAKTRFIKILITADCLQCLPCSVNSVSPMYPEIQCHTSGNHCNIWSNCQLVATVNFQRMIFLLESKSQRNIYSWKEKRTILLNPRALVSLGIYYKITGKGEKVEIRSVAIEEGYC